MKKYLGIRREDKNRWEQRVPFIPEDLKEIKETFGIDAVVQPSKLRIYPDDAFRQKNVLVDEDFSSVNTIFAVKEIPAHLFEENKTYIFFSHTIKGQSHNMGMLKRMMALKCNLIDYERIVNDNNQRLIFFGAYAGFSGIIETLFAFAKKIKLKGIDTCLAQIKQAYAYPSLDAARAHIKDIGRLIAQQGLPEACCPIIVGFAGYGNVSKGAQEIFDMLPVIPISPAEIKAIRNRPDPDTRHLYKVVFTEADMVRPLSGSFELQEYYDHPEKYESVMETYLPDLDILVNCIYWTEKYPRLVTKAFLKKQHGAGKAFNLSLIGDISCDIKGAIEITKAATLPDNACYTYFPGSDTFEDGTQSSGITVMAIDNLPCEFSKESSMFFSNVLKPFAHDIVCADFSQSFEALALPYPIKKALILHNGQLTRDYTYMEKFI